MTRDEPETTGIGFGDPARLRRWQLFGAVAAGVTLGAILYFTRAWPVLRIARPPSLVLAVSCYSASLLLWSLVWVHVISKEAGPINKAKAVSVSLASLIGFLTPMNLGTDLLRSVYGRVHLQLGYASTVAASVVTREMKLHLTLVLLIAVAVTAPPFVEETARGIVVAAATVTLLLLGVYALRTKTSNRIAHRLGIGDLSPALSSIATHLSTTERSAMYIALALGFVLEWLALHTCFSALEVPTTLVGSASLYVLLYVLSRAPVVPQGLGAVEAGGYAVLATSNVATAQIGALLVLWGFVRIFIPVGLALAFSFLLGRQRRAATCSSETVSAAPIDRWGD